MKQFLDREFNDQNLWVRLCDLVRKANPEAADWMEIHPPQDVNSPDNVSLLSAFLWSRTPQGMNFWSSIHHWLLRHLPEKEYPITESEE